MGFIQRGPRAVDLGQDLSALSPPFIRFRVGIALREVSLDVADQMRNGRETPRADDIARQVGEESFDQIEPG